ncbi:BCCT family transporter, partial [Lysinibacillus fusiformis]|uniref:BCCT family transporter n=1 Tax=Lysinibacillus fusiformis TaxID=28031 RepID=UPI0020BED894
LNPTIKSKLVWGILIPASSGVLLYTGGLEALQTASLIARLPFTVILLLLMFSYIKMMMDEVIPLKKKDIQRLKMARKHIEKATKNKEKN